MKTFNRGDEIFVFFATPPRVESFVVDHMIGNNHIQCSPVDGNGFYSYFRVKYVSATKEEALEKYRIYLNKRVGKLRDKIDWCEEKLIDVEYELNEIRRKSP